MDETYVSEGAKGIKRTFRRKARKYDESDAEIHAKVSSILFNSRKSFVSNQMLSDIYQTRVANKSREFTVSKLECNEMMKSLSFKENDYVYPYKVQVRLKPYPNARDVVNSFFRVEKEKDIRKQKDNEKTRIR